MDRTDYDATITTAGQTMTIREALTLDRIPWRAIREAGGFIREIRDTAARHGDDELVKRANRALAR